jgi:hypothetical protein
MDGVLLLGKLMEDEKKEKIGLEAERYILTNEVGVEMDKVK